MGGKDKKARRRYARNRISVRRNRDLLEARSSELGFSYDVFMAMCWKKKAYSTYDNAKRMADRGEARRNVHLRVYRCPICRRWHITHKSMSKQLGEPNGSPSSNGEPRGDVHD